MQPSSNSMRTLKGIFAEPKMNHRRDFLRENKLNLRELQKNTTQKLSQQKLEQELQQRKYLKHYPKTEEHLTGRRSNSQQRYNGEDLRPVHNGVEAAVGSNEIDCSGALGAEKPHRPSYRRSFSLQRESRENIKPSRSTTSFDNNNNNPHAGVKDVRMPPRSASVASVVSKTDSCDKEIQTEDILDEEFLYDALKKCSSTEIGFRNRNIQEEEHYKDIRQAEQNMRSDDNRSTHSREHIQYDYRERNGPEDNKNYHDQYVERVVSNQAHNGLDQNARENYHMAEHERMEDQMQQLYINPHASRESDGPTSARSRETIVSNASKKKSNSNYKLGNREDIQLPRYLEKEKREKEQERMREKSRDPHCPAGHHALEDDERLAALSHSKKKMVDLIYELNHMPMTSQTLRTRTRKREIEKELSQIELDIRAFSKSKCYVVTDPSAAATSQY